MASINSVTITGNLTRDPEYKQLPSGTSVCDLGVAVNSREKQGDDWVDRADFFDCTVFGKQADSAAQYLAKGRPVAITGRLRQDRWQTDNGDNRSKVKIVASVVQFLGSKDDDAQTGQESAPAATPPQDDSSIPFAPSVV